MFNNDGLPISEVSFDLHDNDINPNAWMVRPCEWYRQEYKDCRSIKARFHQYFIYGHTIDCSQWQDDYDHCMKYRRNIKDMESLEKVVQSEIQRKENRIKTIRENNVWEYRKEPPKGWNKSLPEWLLERDKVSNLKDKQNKRKSN